MPLFPVTSSKIMRSQVHGDDMYIEVLIYLYGLHKGDTISMMYFDRGRIRSGLNT